MKHKRRYKKWIAIQGVSDETYLFYFDIAFFWKSILNFRLLENNEIICPFYACFFCFWKSWLWAKSFRPGWDSNPHLYEQKVRAIPLGYEGRLVTRLKFPDETDLHSRVVWLSLFAHKGTGSNPSPSEVFLPKVKIFRNKKHA